MQNDVQYCENTLNMSDMLSLSVSVSAAFWGDIALDEEDMRMFKVDRIINVAQRTVQTFNETTTGEQEL